MSQCFVHNNLYIPNLVLLSILVCIMFFYLYLVFYRKIEKFETLPPSEDIQEIPQIAIPKSKSPEKEVDGCYTFEQNDMNVSMRKCGVYFIEPKKEQQCDKYFRYYDMTDVQIDIAIMDAEKDSSKKELLATLVDIKDYLDKNNYTKCTLEYENAKELDKYYDENG